MIFQCHTCHADVPGYRTIHFGSAGTGARRLCSRCYNEEVARTGPPDFKHVEFEPIDMADAGGVDHRFHFLVRHLGDRVALEAFEVHDGERGGYEFQALEGADVDLFEVMGRLVQRMRRTLSRRHLTTESLGLAIADTCVRGQICSDRESEGRAPLLIIDGREVSWTQFGRMLMTFAGWQFRLEIKDRSEEP